MGIHCHPKKTKIDPSLLAVGAPSVVSAPSKLRTKEVGGGQDKQKKEEAAQTE
jgi:hypothetical protein